MRVKTVVRTLFGTLIALLLAAPAQAHPATFSGAFSSLIWAADSIGRGASINMNFNIPSGSKPTMQVGKADMTIVADFGMYFDGTERDTTATAGVRLTAPKRGKFSMFAQVQAGGVGWNDGFSNRAVGVVPGVGFNYDISETMFVSASVDFVLAPFRYGLEHPTRTTFSLGCDLTKSK